MTQGQDRLGSMMRFSIILMLLLSLNWAHAQPASDVGVEVEADSVEWNEVSGELLFSGGVHLRWGTIELRCLTLNARRGPNGEMNQATASGELSVSGADWSASAGRAHYDKSADTLTLTEQPKIHRKGAHLVGKRIVLHIKSQRLVVEGAKGRIPSPKSLLGFAPKGAEP